MDEAARAKKRKCPCDKEAEPLGFTFPGRACERGRDLAFYRKRERGLWPDIGGDSGITPD